MAAVMDAGLVAFLLAPGLMSPAEGAWGIGLLAVAAPATALHRAPGRRPC